MPSKYQKAGNDLDNIFAAYVGGDPHAITTGYEVGGTDLNQRYSELARGTAAAATGYKVASADLNTIFAAKGTVLDPLVLYPQNGTTTTLPSAAPLLTTVPAGTVTAQTNVDFAGLGWGELHGNSGPSTWPGFGSIQPPTGNGMLWDTTFLVGTSIAAGTWTIDLYEEANDGTFPTGTVIFQGDLHLRAFKRNSGSGIYTAIGDAVDAGVSLLNANILHFAPTFSGAQTSFGTGDELYIDFWFNMTSNLTGTDSSAITFFKSVSGAARTAITTPGYVVA